MLAVRGGTGLYVGTARACSCGSGGSFGRLIRIGKLPVNVQAQAFYNVVKPDDDPTAEWTLRLQVQFLFPK